MLPTVARPKHHGKHAFGPCRFSVVICNVCFPCETVIRLFCKCVSWRIGLTILHPLKGATSSEPTVYRLNARDQPLPLIGVGKRLLAESPFRCESGGAGLSLDPSDKNLYKPFHVDRPKDACFGTTIKLPHSSANPFIALTRAAVAFNALIRYARVGSWRSTNDGLRSVLRMTVP